MLLSLQNSHNMPPSYEVIVEREMFVSELKNWCLPLTDEIIPVKVSWIFTNSVEGQGIDRDDSRCNRFDVLSVKIITKYEGCPVHVIWHNSRIHKYGGLWHIYIKFSPLSLRPSIASTFRQNFSEKIASYLLRLQGYCRGLGRRPWVGSTLPYALVSSENKHS